MSKFLLRMFFVAPILIPATYILVAFVCVFIPVGLNYHRKMPNLVEIIVEVGVIHTAFVLPVKNQYFDFSNHLRGTNIASSNSKGEYISLSWGDRKFFLDTPTWSEFNVITALNALFNSAGSVIHVEYFKRQPSGRAYYTLYLPSDKYIILVDYIMGFINLDENGRPKQILGHRYYGSDEFYEGIDKFHAFHTCNIWTSRGLKKAGIKTAIWSPFIWGIQYHLND